MPWILLESISDSGESPGSESRIGFRGTRFSVAGSSRFSASLGRLYLTDYSGEKTYYEPKSEAESYINQIRRVLRDPSWTGRMRIRYGGDTYCKVRGGVKYVGRTDLGDNENFPGYSFGDGGSGGPMGPSGRPPKRPPKYPYLYSGPHNHGQVGERWTIPEPGFAARRGAIGNVGIRTRGAWTWSASKHHSLVRSLRSMFRLEDFIRIYITCYGEIVRPIQEKYWGAYRIPVQDQLMEVNSKAPSAVVSMNDRMSRASAGKTTLYFICGHVDELMSGSVPQVDTRDINSRIFDEDGK